jgi:hypothetical protein
VPFVVKLDVVKLVLVYVRLVFISLVIEVTLPAPQ